MSIPDRPDQQPPPARQPVRVAVAAVIVQDGRMLVGRRRGPENRGGGRFAMPGGAVEPGEGLTAAVEREVFEETGLRVHALPYSRVRPDLFLLSHAPPGGEHFVVLFFECRVVGGELVNREPALCDGWRWMNFSQLAALVSPAAVAAWQAGRDHEELNWIPLPQLAYYRDHLGIV